MLSNGYLIKRMGKRRPGNIFGVRSAVDGPEVGGSSGAPGQPCRGCVLAGRQFFHTSIFDKNRETRWKLGPYNYLVALCSALDLVSCDKTQCGIDHPLRFAQRYGGCVLAIGQRSFATE
jgi:hypothetical protein